MNDGAEVSIETINESIYDYPKYYDLVFGADCAAEIRFILGCADRYLDQPPQRLFEPACGTGRLLYWLAKRRYTVGGIDLNAKAVDFCNARFHRRSWPPPAWQADMSAFEVDQPYDLAFNTINSFRHLSTETAARNHFICMGNAVRRGGLYLLGIHLTPTEVPPSETESWSARRGHLAVNTHMWTEDRDPRKRVERFGIRFDIHRPSHQFRIVDQLVLRSYKPAQFNRLLRSSKCWEIAETYSFAYDLSDPIEVDGTTEDVVYVLRRL